MKYLLMCLLVGAIGGTLIATGPRMTPEERLAADRPWRDIASYVALATMLVLLVLGLAVALEEMSR
jgi:hypothetical protein